VLTAPRWAYWRTKPASADERAIRTAMNQPRGVRSLPPGGLWVPETGYRL